MGRKPKPLPVSFPDRVAAARAKLYAQAILLVRNPHDAHDLVQDTMVRALEKQHYYREDDNLNGWLATILRNLFSSQYQREKRCTLVSLDGYANIDNRLHDLLPSAEVNNGPANLFAEQMGKLLTRLTPREQEVMRLRILGYGYEEMAAELGMAGGTVRATLFRARCFLEGDRSSHPSRRKQSER